MIGAAMGLVSTPLRLKALIIGALAMAAVCLALTVWALFERSGRLSLKVEVVALQAQKDVLAEAIGRQNDGVTLTAKAGQEAVAETRRLLGMVDVGIVKMAAVRDEARAIVSKPPPTRPDGKPKDCTDALGEIRKRAQP